MPKQRLFVFIAGSLLSVAVPASAQAVGGQPLTAAEIVQKNVDARGGLEAWRKVQTMVWIGHIDTGNEPVATVPFMLEAKRPNKTHFEVRAPNDQVVMRVYDGARGWSLFRTATAKPDLRPYSIDELKFAHDSYVIDGPLMDYRAKGVAVTLEGTDELEKRKAYRLKATLPSGATEHVWVDAETFLDVKFDRTASNGSGIVTVHYRSYRPVDGLQLPVIIETGTDPARQPEKMTIERIALNPPLEDRIFAMPALPKPGTGHRAMVTISPTGEEGAPPLMPPPPLPSGIVPQTARPPLSGHGE